jgi:hypothetical protein
VAPHYGRFGTAAGVQDTVEVADMDERIPTTIFYPLRAGVSVTDTHLTVHGRRYKICDLTYPQWERMSPSTARRLTVHFVGVEAVIAIAIAAVASSLLAVIAAATYLAGVSGVMWIGMYRWPIRLRLSANYRGRDVVLYISSDHTQFHQVCRSLIRATELNLRRSTT